MLTYCMNVHPGETLGEQVTNLATLTTEIARRHRARHSLAADHPFGVGLRFSQSAAAEFKTFPEARESFQAICADESLIPFTLNAFPYGVFHRTKVKEDVYRPTWSDPLRVAYTADAAFALATLMPAGQSRGSISTAPLSYKTFNEDSDVAIAHVVQALEHLRMLHNETGKFITLAMEPEPGCQPETTDETISVIHRIVKAANPSTAAHISVCFDTAHVAVQFEALAEAVKKYTAAGIAIGKCQLSAALAGYDTPETRLKLAHYAESTYLHQTIRRRPDGTLDRFNDLPEALATEPCPRAELRTHFHVPLFETGDDTLYTTTDLLADPAFADALRANGCDHFEVETYTWDVWKTCANSEFDILDGIVEELATVAKLSLPFSPSAKSD